MPEHYGARDASIGDGMRMPGAWVDTKQRPATRGGLGGVKVSGGPMSGGEDSSSHAEEAMSSDVPERMQCDFQSPT